MANAFDVAMGAIFRDVNMATSAVWRSGGYGGPALVLRVLMRAPDMQKSWHEVAVSSATLTVEVRASDLASPAAGDVVTISGADYTVQGTPERDAAGLIWAVELVGVL